MIPQPGIPRRQRQETLQPLQGGVTSPGEDLHSCATLPLPLGDALVGVGIL